MLLLKCATLSFVLGSFDCLDWNKFIKLTEYKLDRGSTWLNRMSNEVSLDTERRFFADQRQDHFDTFNRNTWHHTYFVHKPNGSRSDVPIVFVGGEGEEVDNFPFFNELLPKQGQGYMTFTLAHRYYQIGQHVNPTEYFNVTRDYKLLSSKQALADLASFIEMVVLGEYKFTKLPIIFGCSYPGSLAIWFREKYPHLSTGAIGLSGPIYAFDNFHQYLEVGEKAIKDLIPECFPLLVNAKKTLQDSVQDHGTEFANYINLCTDTSFKDWEDVLKVGWVQISLVFASELGQGGSVGNPKHLCHKLEERGPFALLADVLGTSRGKCSDPQRVVERIMYTHQMFERELPPWSWQKCSEFGWFKTHSEDNLFTLFSLDECHRVCKEEFGVDVDLLKKSLSQTNVFYGGRNITGLTKVLILNGADDPWSAPSMYEYGNDYNGLVSKLIPKGHHCARVDGQFPKEAKESVKQAIDTWLK